MCRTKKRTELTRRRFCVEVAAAVASTVPMLPTSPAEPSIGLKPLIKYRGGKSKEFVHYEKFIPHDYETYYEPFVGGGATFFKLMPRKAVIGDINEPLINFYRDVRDRFDELSKELAAIQAIYEKNQFAYREKKKKDPDKRIPNANEEFYYYLRDQYNGLAKATYSRAALYFFINKTSYSGMIRYNAQGHFNVPFGRYENFNTALVTKEHSLLLQRTELLCADYEESFKRAGKGDFMYLDPPYDCIFNDYGNQQLANGFDEAEHRRLAKLFRKLNCRAMMVIGHTPLTEELYGDLVKAEYAKDYAVNIRNRFHSQATHFVVTNYNV
jgi:DNA adenine methylase